MSACFNYGYTSKIIRSVYPSDLSNCASIKFILDPRIVEDEKIIEGWFLERLGRDEEVDNALGDYDCFGNNLPVGYLKFADVIGYQNLYMDLKKYKVIEVKKEPIIFPDNITQLINYMDWLAENIAKGYQMVEGALITRGFDGNTISFVRNFIQSTGRVIRLAEFNYLPPNYERLNVSRVV